MKLYVIPAGITVILANEDGTMETISSKKEATFSETVEDVVRNYNNRNTTGYTTKAPSHIQRMFGGNYAMFSIGSEHAKKPYKYVIVNYNDVEVLC